MRQTDALKTNHQCSKTMPKKFRKATCNSYTNVQFEYTHTHKEHDPRINFLVDFSKEIIQSKASDNNIKLAITSKFKNKGIK